MKKILIIAAFMAAATMAFAKESPRYNDAHRYFESGFDYGIGFSNSYIKLSDILTDTIDLDFPKIASEMNKEGLAFNFDANYNSYSNLHLKTFGAGVFQSMETTGYVNIPQGLFELVAEGNEIGTPNEGKFNIRSDIFIDFGGWFGTKINTPIGGLKVSVRPAFYIPLLHFHEANVNYSLSTAADGTLSASGQVQIPIYTAYSIEDTIENGNSSVPIGAVFSVLGIDVGLDAEYALLPILDVGARIKGLPLLPARLKHRTLTTSDFTFTMSPLLQNIEEGIETTTSSSSNFAYDTNNILVIRPFKIGATAVYKPFRNKLLTLHPNLDLAVYNGVYADVGLKLQSNLGEIFILSLSSNLEDLLWKQRIGFILNFRIIEFETVIGGQSQDFLKSFGGAGFNVKSGIRVGF